MPFKSKTTHLAIGGGVYEEHVNGRATGRFWARRTVNKRRTWKLLKATARRAALHEASAASFRPATDSFAAVAEVYLRSGCPTKKRRWKSASDAFKAQEVRNVRQLNGHFRTTPIGDIGLAELEPYMNWRVHRRAVKPTRAVDKEIQTLSNVINFAVFITRQTAWNPIHSNRPRYHQTRRHARDRMPDDADIIHQLAEHFFDHVRSEVFGWLTYFAMFTGCRISELLRLRVDAPRDAAGFVTRTAPFKFTEGRPLYTGVGYLDLGRRSKQQLSGKKDGLNPECVLWPEFAEMLDCFEHWHETRYPAASHYFPGMTGAKPVNATSFNQALRRALRELGLDVRISPHGFRSYFATKLHRDGFRDEDIAAALGDQTVALMSAVYRDRASGAALSWLPRSGLPGWLRWRRAQKVVALPRT